MQPFIFITVLSGLTLSAAAPHALSHPRLHVARALDIEPRALNGPLVAGRQAQTFNKSPLGQCGGSSGYGCAPGLCCSQYGYCGSGPGYCGSDSSDASAATPSGGPLNATDPRYQSPNGAPGYGQPSASGAAPASGAPAPSAPAASGSPPTYQPPAGSSAPAAPSPSSPAASPSPAPPAASPSPASPPAPSSSPSQGGGGSGGGAGYGNTYKMYSGNGSPSQGWPSSSDWMDFEGMWSANEPTIKISCAQFGTANPSDSEVTELKAAVQSVAQSAGLDPRFLLAIMMQESKGCVRVPTTDNGVVNPGLLQSHDGAGTCNKDGDIQNPCPSQEITQMLQDGAEGTSSGDGLKQCLSQTTGTDESAKYYQAATIYNSGNLPQNLDDNTATACYASDIANRMTGWTTATTQCTA